MIAIIDYGVGNLFSLSCSLKKIGHEPIITADEAVLHDADRVILPGVGAFGDAARKLRETGIVPTIDAIVSEGRPLLGICVGMQLLFDVGYEFGKHGGLGYLRGEVCAMQDDLTCLGLNLKIPQIGWNSLDFKRNDCQLTKYIKPGSFVYYVHSYYAKKCDDDIVASSDYGVEVPGIVSRGCVYGTQFHPEKSGDVGLSVLKAFCEV